MAQYLEQHEINLDEVGRNPSAIDILCIRRPDYLKQYAHDDVTIRNHSVSRIM